MIDILSQIFAGLGLLLLGLKILESSMRDLTSGHMREVIKKHTSNDFLAAFWGAILGFVTGDPAVVGFIAAALCTGKTISLHRGGMMSLWSNFGSCFLYLIVFIKIDVFLFFLLGVSGFAFYAEKPVKWRHFIGCLIGVLLMLYGLTVMMSQSEEIAQSSFVQSYLHDIQDHLFLPFILSAILMSICQSDILILVLVANFTQAQVLSNEQAIVMVYGMLLGLSISNIFFIIPFKGTVKKLILVQTLLELSIVVIFGLLFLLEIHTSIPLLNAFSAAITDSVWSQLIFIIFFTYLIMTIVFSFSLDRILYWMKKVFYIQDEVDPNKPQFIADKIKDPDSAVDLLQQELFGLFKRLPKNIEYRLSEKNKDGVSAVLQARHSQFHSITLAMEALLRDLTSKHISQVTADKMVLLIDQLQYIIALEDGINYLTQVELPSNAHEGLHSLLFQLYEAQQALLETILEAIESKSKEDINIMMNAMTNIKTTMKKIRDHHINQMELASLNEKALILSLTGIFERNIWLMSSFLKSNIPTVSDLNLDVEKLYPEPPQIPI